LWQTFFSMFLNLITRLYGRGTTDTIRLWRCVCMVRCTDGDESWELRRHKGFRARWRVNTLAAHWNWRRWHQHVYLLQRRPPAVVLFAAVFSMVVCDVTLFGRPPTCADLCCSARPRKLCRRITWCYLSRLFSRVGLCSSDRRSTHVPKRSVVVPNGSQQRNAASSECKVVTFKKTQELTVKILLTFYFYFRLITKKPKLRLV